MTDLNLPNPCTIKKCGTGRRRRGYCVRHYTRYLADGLIPRVLIKDNLVSFWAKVRKGENEDDCWEWLYLKNKDGYGRLSFGGKNETASRVSFFIHNGHWPQHMALHHCDNPGCCNPKHIYDGTAKDNAQDASRRGRYPKTKPHMSRELATLPPRRIAKIQTEIAKGWLPSVIARRNGVMLRTVTKLKAGHKAATVVLPT